MRASPLGGLMLSLGVRLPRKSWEKTRTPHACVWCRVTRHSLVFRGLTGSQRTPGFGASQLGIRA